MTTSQVTADVLQMPKAKAKDPVKQAVSALLGLGPKQYAAAIAQVQSERKKAARLGAEKAAAEYGFTLADVAAEDFIRKPKKQPKKPVTAKKPKASKPKYQNPDNAHQKWTGNGRRPNWVMAALEGGKVLEDLQIKNSLDTLRTLCKQPEPRTLSGAFLIGGTMWGQGGC